MITHWLNLRVPRNDVESLNTAPALSVLNDLYRDAETVRKFQERLYLSFAGYDDDSRELYEIPEVRRFIAELDSKFPFWFYFHQQIDGTLMVIALSACSVKVVEGRIKVDDPDELKNFVETHLSAFNKLFDYFKLEDSVNDDMSRRLLEYFRSRLA
jgi:hypothetical protein